MRDRYSPSVDLLSHLDAFVAVADAGSFTRGADACGVPQPVVSRRVSALEKHLGGRLLRRTSRSVELTSLGRTLLPYASDLVARADHLVEVARAHATDYVVALPRDADPRALVAAKRAAEDTQLALGFVEDDPAGRTAALAAGRVAAALTASPPDAASLGGPLGAGTATDELRGRRVHLDQLRRRDPDARPRVLHLDAEDDVPWVRDPVRRAAGAAGLRPDQVLVGTGRTDALTAAHEHGDVLLCTRAWATRQDLRWRDLAGVDVARSYAFLQPSGARGTPMALQAALPALARAVGLDAPVPEPAPMPEPT